jgi:hypothetical protein
LDCDHAGTRTHHPYMGNRVMKITNAIALKHVPVRMTEEW